MANHDDSNKTSKDLCELLLVALQSLDPTITRKKDARRTCPFHGMADGKGLRNFAYITHFKGNEEIKVDFLCDAADSAWKSQLPDEVKLQLKKSIKSPYQKAMPYHFKLSDPRLIESVAKFLHDQSYALTKWKSGDQNDSKIIQAYFSMLFAELKGNDHIEADRPTKVGASKGHRSDLALETRYQNISAILLYKYELPYVQRYQPSTSYPKNLEGLEDAVAKYVKDHLKEIKKLVDLAQNPPGPETPDPELDLQSILVNPPQMPIIDEPPPRSITRRPPGFDYAKREANNRSLGRAGEQFVFKYEKQRLVQAGRSGLAKKVEWTSEDKGDGTGYDISSFDANGTVRYIEVKTTKSGIGYPFFLSRNELEFSKNHPDEFYVYRVFNYGRNPKFYMLNGALDNCCDLTPESYRARVKSKNAADPDNQ
jgi:hypothetical protein